MIITKLSVPLHHQNPPSLSTMLKCAGRFILNTMRERILYTKGYTNSQDLVKLLQQRGLSVSNPIKAEQYISSIGYYRLSAYMYPLLQIPKELHRYKDGASFDQVMTLYRFDKKLRLLMFNEIEKIEIAVRSAVVNIGCEITNNPFWITDDSNFISADRFLHTMEIINTELQRSREDFILHFKKVYSNVYPPAWILTEILPFGVITNIYANIRNHKIKKLIAQKFGLQIAPFESWLTTITLMRNACCHHARVWNKQNTIRPMVPNKLTGEWITQSTNTLRVYFDLCIMKYLLNVISPQNDMTSKLKMLLSSYPTIDISAMGFTNKWENEPLWR